MISPRLIKISFFTGFMFSLLNPVFAVDMKFNAEDTLVNCFFRNLYNFSFHEADSLAGVIDSSDIDNLTRYNIKSNLAWWKLLSGDEIETNVRSCELSLNESIRSGSKSRQKDINSLLNLIYSYSLKARLENYTGNTLKSFISFYKSITYIEECIEAPVKDERLTLVLGLYYYIIDYLNHEYFMMSAMLFTVQKGDKIKGLAFLGECSSSGNEMISTEADYFLLKIYSYLEKDYSKAKHYGYILTQQYPGNLVYSVEYYKLLLKMHEMKEAELFRNNLLEKINKADNINMNQKNHFILQLGETPNTSVKR